jgi:quinoprotein glucose dehydrogenase
MINLTRRLMMTAMPVAALLSRAPAFAQALPAARPADTEWRNYANDLASTRYSALDQITPANFNTLQVAWTFKTDSLGGHRENSYEGTPLLIKGRLFCTAGSRRDVVSLDAATGELLWMHREDEGARAAHAPRQLSGHGVAYWTDGTAERILYVTTGYRMLSLDAKTGIPDPAFGENGVVDLKKFDDQDMDLVTADIGLHATPTVAKNVVIVGAAHTAGDEPKIRKNAIGYVRGFDVRTGQRKWIFHTIPRKGEFGYDSWLVAGQAEAAGNAGDWAQISADEELGLAYLGVELPTGDENGEYRHGNGLFGESIVAVDIETGARKWHYQTEHHGIWDRDIPCAAILCDIPHNGKIVKALAQPTKQAFLFVLDRETGKPIWPIPEVKVPAGDVPGEWYAPTQPVPSKPPAYDLQGVSVNDLVDFTPAIKARALEIASHYRMGGLYTPPTLSKPEGPWGTLTLPGLQGGTNWPGGAYDPESHIVYVFSKTQMATTGIVHNTNMAVSEFDYVHGVTGTPVTEHGLMGAAPEGDAPPRPPRGGDVDPSLSGPIKPGQITVAGLPLNKPPYGRITALDLKDGTMAWQIAHGETPDAIRKHPLLQGLKIPRTGQAANLGPLVTRTLVICGDGGNFTDETGRFGARLRAYDKATGEEKAAVFLPAPQSGAPMTYMLNGRQHIVLTIAGSGTNGAQMIAFRLPNRG